jgi:hypothetical protein
LSLSTARIRFFSDSLFVGCLQDGVVPLAIKGEDKKNFILTPFDQRRSKHSPYMMRRQPPESGCFVNDDTEALWKL